MCQFSSHLLSAKIQKIFNISFVLNKKVLILFNTMGKMNKISTFIRNLHGIKPKSSFSKNLADECA